MNADPFAMLRRSLSAAPSRRGLAATLTGLAVGGPLLGLVDTAAKKKRKKKKRCRAGTQKCAGACFPDDACCPPCTAGLTCLDNGGCAILCPTFDCPAGCACAPGVILNYCIPDPPPCDEFQQACSSDADCPSGQGCILTACPGEPADRCLPLCTD